MLFGMEYVLYGLYGIIGSLFFDQTVNGDCLFAMLKNPFWSTVRRVAPSSILIFMHDGTQPHCMESILEFVDG